MRRLNISYFIHDVFYINIMRKESIITERCILPLLSIILSETQEVGKSSGIGRDTDRNENSWAWCWLYGDPEDLGNA